MKPPGPDNYTGEHECEMWELDHKESWALKNWWFQTVVLEKTLESPLDCKEIQPVHPKGNQFWIFTGRTEATWREELTHWESVWCWERLRAWGEGGTEGKMVGWHHQLNGDESEQTLGDSEGQGSLACCNPRGHRIGYYLSTEQQQKLEIVKEKVVPILYNIFQKWKRKKLTLWGQYYPDTEIRQRLCTFFKKQKTTDQYISGT